MVPLGLEPRTTWLWVRCSNQLSYGTNKGAILTHILILYKKFTSIYYSISWHNSISTPFVDFGCKNAINLLSAPFLGVSWIILKPSFCSRFISSSISSTANAIWWMPSPFLSINLAIGLSSTVACNNSILLGPHLKKDVLIPSLSTSSIL